MAATFSTPEEQHFWQNGAASFISGIHRGLEKESLRITPDGQISQQPHPEALGSTLTHRFITTDYSEALLEFITPATDQLNQPLKDLNDIHHFVYQHIGDELLWATSMPCVMGDEESVPIAQYGSSNSGRMKTVYRVGLGHRYGRFMQTIAGVHYNFSFSDALWQALYEQANSPLSLMDYKSERYMGVIRNFLRRAWIIPFLFGASPALCESFLKGRPTRLKTLVPGTRYGEYATSLRMSDLGYQNNIQSRLKVSYNSLSEYIANLESAIRTEDPYYVSLGVKNGSEYRQLNANVLQIENEFYSNVRPKRTTQSGERPTKALRNRGVEYIEVRALDTNPFSPIGVSQQQLNFIDILLLSCLIQPSPCITEREEAENNRNFARVVKGGRDPQLFLLRNNRQQPVQSILDSLFDELQLAAELLDSAYGSNQFTTDLSKLSDVARRPQTSFSGRIVDEILKRNDGFFPYAMEISKEYANQYRQTPLEPSVKSAFEKEALESINNQTAIEQADTLSFEEFLANYYA